MDNELAQILDGRFLEGYGDFDPEQLRSARERCRRVETSLSYLRRLAQARIDIVTAELERRAAGGDPTNLDDLVARLPSVLADDTTPGRAGPMPRYLAPGRIEGSLVEELAGMEVEARLNELPLVADDWLETTRDALVAYEHRVSELRRELFERIDVLGVELGRRYRDGETDIDAVIGS